MKEKKKSGSTDFPAYVFEGHAKGLKGSQLISMLLTLGKYHKQATGFDTLSLVTAINSNAEYEYLEYMQLLIDVRHAEVHGDYIYCECEGECECDEYVPREQCTPSVNPCSFAAIEFHIILSRPRNHMLPGFSYL